MPWRQHTVGCEQTEWPRKNIRSFSKTVHEIFPQYIMFQFSRLSMIWLFYLTLIKVYASFVAHADMVLRSNWAMKKSWHILTSVAVTAANGNYIQEQWQRITYDALWHNDRLVCYPRWWYCWESLAGTFIKRTKDFINFILLKSGLLWSNIIWILSDIFPSHQIYC